MSRKPSGKTPQEPAASTAADSLLRVELPARQRKRPRQARSVALVDALKAAGRDILENEGRAALSVHRLAEHAGVAISSIYEYFPTIESLIAAIFDDYRVTARSEVMRCIEQLPPSARLMDGIETILGVGLASLRRWLAIDSEYSVKAVYYAELVRLEMVESEPFWSSQVIPALMQRFADEVRVDNREIAGFLAYQAVLALPRALVIERPEFLREAESVRLLARMLHALLGGTDAEQVPGGAGSFK